MSAPVGLKYSYEAQLAAHQAITRYRAQLDSQPSISDAQAHTLAELISALAQAAKLVQMHRPKRARRKPRMTRVNGERRAWQPLAKPAALGEPLAGAKPTAAVAPGPEASGVDAGGIESSSQSPTP